MFYKDLGILENGHTLRLYVTKANNIQIHDINSDFFKEFIGIIRECDFPFSLDPAYSYYIGSFKEYKKGGRVIEQVRTEETFKTDKTNVLALQIMSKDIYHDIYSVCTSKKFRGIGENNLKRVLKYTKLDRTTVTSSFTQVLFNFILDTVCSEYPNGVFSLGVLFDNPYFEAAVKLYLRSGFGMPSISRNLNIAAYPNPLLKLEARCGFFESQRELWEENFEKALNFKKTYYQRYLGETIEITISRRLNRYLTSLLSLNTETAGGFTLSPVIPDTKYELEYICGIENLGTTTNVHLPNVSITMHTHPISVMRGVDCHEAWPSSVDFTIYLRLFMYYGLYNKQPSLNMVVSEWGYYINQASQYFYYFCARGFRVIDLVSTTCEATLLCAKFVVNFLVIYPIYLDFERLATLANPYTRYIFMSKIDQISIKSMIKQTSEMINRILFFYDNHKDLYVQMCGIIQVGEAFPTIFNTITNFLDVAYPLDIIRIIHAARQPDGPEELHKFLLSMKSGNFEEPILQECKANNIDITEPLLINNFIDDFLVNPDIESAGFMFYNIDKSKPYASKIMRLQDVIDRTTMVQQMRTANNYTVGLYPPFVQDYSVNKLERSVLKHADSCDLYSFYSDLNNINAIPAIK